MSVSEDEVRSPVICFYVLLITIDEYGVYRLRRFLFSGVLLVLIAFKVTAKLLYNSNYFST